MPNESSSLHCHLVLLGQVGAGKSATGNTIVGGNTFQSKTSLKAVTQDVQQSAEVTIDGLTVDVYDTPGFLSPGVQRGEIERKCQKLLRLDASVPTVFLLVISTDRFAEQEQKAAELVLNFLGHNNLQKTRIIFTKGDELKDNNVTVEEYMEESEELKELVQKLNNRYLVFNNRHDPSNREQAEELIKQIRNTHVIHSENQQSPSACVEEAHRNHSLERLRDQSRSSPTGGLAAQLKREQQRTMANNLRHRGSQPSNNAEAQLQNSGNINIVLLGKIGVGKRSSGNTILGENRFKCKRSLSAVTNVSSVERSQMGGRTVSVIDTPGFFCPNLTREQLSREFEKSVCLTAPGVHAFLFVVPFGQFTEQEEQILMKVKEVYGKDVLKHVIILFTYGDECDRENVQSEIEGNEIARRVVEKCQGYHVLNNRDLNDRHQVEDLLLKIDSMIERNQGFYTKEMYDWAHKTT